MLSQQFRFHGHGSLKFVYRNGQTTRCHLMTLKTTPNPRRTVSRCSVVVSKKISKSAVVRNRIRRRVYELVRTHLPHIPAPHDIVIIISHAEVATIAHQELADVLHEQLFQAGILPSPLA